MTSESHDGPATAAAHQASERRGYGYVLLAVACFATSPILTRVAGEGLGIFEIAAGRLLIAGVVVLAVARWQRLAMPGRRDMRRFALFGLVTAVHFGAFAASLFYTTIAHSLAIIYTAPVFSALLSLWFLHEAISLRQWLGMAVAVLGVAVLAGFEPHFDATMLFGDLLALTSAVAFAFYGIMGRSQRHRYPLLSYSGTVYMAAGLWLLPFALLTFSAGGYTLATTSSLLALGLVPLGVGHTFYNAALRVLNATVVNILAMQEVTISIILAAFLLGEIPALSTIAGVALTLIGVVLVVL